MHRLRNIVVSALFVILLLFCIGAQVKESFLYVKIEKENLRDAPKGKKIAEILQSTEMKILEEKDKWVKVQITGWIWKESTTPDRSEIAKLKAKQKKAGTEITPGFVYENIRFKSYCEGYVEVIGEMTNNSGMSYIIVSFTISVYDKNENLLGTSPIIICDFGNGQTKSFDTIIEADYSSLSKYNKYNIEFGSGL